MHWSVRFALLLSFAGPIAAWAGDNHCGPFTTAEDVLRCAERNSFAVLRAEAERSTSQAGLSAATQLLNPELSLNSVSGRTGQETRSETDIALGFPIELGGRRISRRRAAEARIERSEVELEQARAKARYEALLSLHRYRQLLEEQALIEEAFDSFSKLVVQYEGRPRLSPEQEVSLSVFRLAKGDYVLRRAENREALAQVAGLFRRNLGVELADLRSVLPSAPRKWPAPPSASASEASPRVRLTSADLHLAETEVAKTSSETWPVLTLGPSAKLLREAGEDQRLYGFNLSFALPVLSLNRGAKAQALSAESAARIGMEQSRQEASARKAELLEIYNASVSAMDESLSSLQLEKRHRHAEGLFLKGLVPSSLVVEAHRSLVDYTHSRNERELKALDAYLELNLENGRYREVIP